MMIDILLCIPFLGILLSVALFPLWRPEIWHHHFGKIVFGWMISFVILAFYRWGGATLCHSVLHTLLTDYFPFIIMVGTLYTITSGIFLQSFRLAGPWENVAWLSIGAMGASLIGTTGASMLLIRPLIRANAWRHQNAHVKIFFIFMVGNVGGLLTPLGDPPLFIGFLQGVPFLWPLVHLCKPWLLANGLLIFIFFWMDYWFYRREKSITEYPHGKGFSVKGKINFLLLGLVVLTIAVSGYIKTNIFYNFYGVSLSLESILRDVILLYLGGLSFKITPQEARVENSFSWAPLKEIGKIFLGIFVTILPLIQLLKMGVEGPLKPLFIWLNENGIPNNSLYFWLGGLFSSFLDNAPTYLVFFHAAGGDAGILSTVHSTTLMAISTGAVFMGAMTYIGNAPNFMIKSIAEQYHVKMPSFFKYIFWALVVLLPVFMVVDKVFYQ